MARLLSFPRYLSSKTCSCRGVIKGTLALRERPFRCDCGFEAERDVNRQIGSQRDTRSPFGALARMFAKLQELMGEGAA